MIQNNIFYDSAQSLNIKMFGEMKIIIFVLYEFEKAGPLPLILALSIQLQWSYPVHDTHIVAILARATEISFDKKKTILRPWVLRSPNTTSSEV